MRYTTDPWNLLLGLAWLGATSTQQIGRLWLPGRCPSSVRGQLLDLRRDGVIERRMWSDWDAQHATPVRQDALWSLSRKGLVMLKDSAQFPAEYKGIRPRKLFPHDTRTIDVVVRLIELARELQHNRTANLSGIYVEREIRLDPLKRRPVMDALVIITQGGEVTPAHLVPWSRDPTIGSEQRVRYAIENDRASEPLSVIAGKAAAYQHAGTPQWQQRYGPFPLTLWLVPDENRLDAIMQTWRAAWPVGKWLITTDTWLAGDNWVEHDRGQIRRRGLFYRAPRTPAQVAALPIEQA
jgi:hypothetical protein